VQRLPQQYPAFPSFLFIDNNPPALIVDGLQTPILPSTAALHMLVESLEDLSWNKRDV